MKGIYRADAISPRPTLAAAGGTGGRQGLYGLSPVTRKEPEVTETPPPVNVNVAA